MEEGTGLVKVRNILHLEGKSYLQTPALPFLLEGTTFFDQAQCPRYRQPGRCHSRPPSTHEMTIVRCRSLRLNLQILPCHQKVYPRTQGHSTGELNRKPTHLEGRDD